MQLEYKRHSASNGPGYTECCQGASSDLVRLHRYDGRASDNPCDPEHRESESCNLTSVRGGRQGGGEAADWRVGII